MPASSLVKYASQRISNGKKLSWHRLDIDGLPFRGDNPGYLKQEEYDERVVKVCDAHFGFFDMDKPAESDAYLRVLDASANGWFQIVCLERFVNKTMRHYVEWLEYYLEDGVTRTPCTQQSAMELERGQVSMPGLADYHSR